MPQHVSGSAPRSGGGTARRAAQRRGDASSAPTFLFDKYAQVMSVTVDLAGVAEQNWHRTIFSRP